MSHSRSGVNIDFPHFLQVVWLLPILFPFSSSKFNLILLIQFFCKIAITTRDCKILFALYILQDDSFTVYIWGTYLTKWSEFCKNSRECIIILLKKKCYVFYSTFLYSTFYWLLNICFTNQSINLLRSLKKSVQPFFIICNFSMFLYYHHLLLVRGVILNHFIFFITYQLAP